MKRSHLVLVIILIGFLIFAGARLGLYLLYPEYFKALSASDVAASFIQGARFDASVLFIVLGPVSMMLLIPIKSSLWRKFWGWLAFAAFVGAAILLVVDIVYFGYVGRHLANELHYLANELPFMTGVAWQYKFYVLALIICIFLVALLYRKLLSREPKPEKFLWLKIIVCIALSFIFIRSSFSDKPIASIDAFRSGMVRGNLIVNGVFTSYRYKNKTTEKSFFMEDAEAFEIMGLNPENEYPLLKTYLEGPNRKNIIVIIMESWSAHYTGALSENKFGVTPNFDNLSSRGALFTRHYAPQKRSIDGIQAILTGIPPIENIAALGFGLEILSKGNIGEIARQNGYSTIFMQTSQRRSYYMDSIAKALGFDYYYGMEDIPLLMHYPDPKASVFGWDYDGLAHLGNVLNSKSSPFFAVFFSGTTHTPFPILPEQFMKYDAKGNTEEAFLNALFYSDYSLGQFIESVSTKNWFNDTIFIITADHTLGKFDNATFPEDYHIPLLVFSPANIEPGVYGYVTSHLDILPTILQLSEMRGQSAIIGSNVLDNESDKKAYINDGLTSVLIKNEGWVRITDNITLSNSYNMSFARMLYYYPRFINMLAYNKKQLVSDTLNRRAAEMAEELMAYEQVVDILINKNRWVPNEAQVNKSDDKNE